MSGNFQCPLCKNFYKSNNGLSQHMNKCKNIFDSSTEESNEFSEIFSDVDDMSLDSEDSNRIEEFQNIPASGSEIRENQPVTQDLFEYEEYYGDVSLSHSSIIPNSEEMSQSIEEFRNSEKSFQRIEESINSEESIEEEKSEIEIKEFPNEAYADLMTLVTKHNLNNKAGNEIIKFFNKHSNVPNSPLPKNITAGRNYMDKMNLSQLSHDKHLILVHNNVEYFIYYRPIVKCIENLLSNPEINKHLVYKYKNLMVIIY
jgi:hypothetical protein